VASAISVCLEVVLELLFPLSLLGFAILHVWLAINVIRVRRREKIAVGDEGHDGLQRAMRVQANFLEQSLLPLLILLLLFLQDAVLAAGLLSWLLLVGRLLHAHGMSRQDEDFRFRVAGMMTSFAVTLLAPIFLLLQFV